MDCISRTVMNVHETRHEDGIMTGHEDGTAIALAMPFDLALYQRPVTGHGSRCKLPDN